MKKKIKNEWKDEELNIPNWVRIILIIIAILALLSIMFKAGEVSHD